MDGVPLGARFSIATNRLNYCGPADAEPALYAAIVGAGPTDPARAALRGFEALLPYLEAIGAAAGLDPFDERVVEAYWIGNELLDRFPADRFAPLLDALARRGLPRAEARRLAEHLPPHPIPHHMFHVAYVGVGAVTGHVPTTVANVEACRPAWATVGEVHADRGTLRLSRPLLHFHHDRWSVGEPADQEVRYDPKVLPGIAPGREVAVHWGWPALELTARQAENLRKYTGLALAEANRARADAGRTGPAS